VDYWVLFDQTTGAIYPSLSATEPVSSGMGVLGPYPQATAPTDVVMAYTYPSRYLVQNGALVAQPYFTLAAAEANGVWTLTATLNDPPASPPADVTFTVAGNAFTASLTNGTATLAVAVHASCAGFAVPASVAATGCVAGSTTFSGTATPTVGLQAYTPTSGNPTVAPTGAGSLAFLRAYYGSVVNQANVMGDLATADSLALHTLLAVVLPPLVKAGTVTLDASQTAALQYLTTDLVPELPVTLENAAPGGTPNQPTALYVADQTIAAQAFADYAADVAPTTGVPNLA